jgi:hypothetical protein
MLDFYKLLLYVYTQQFFLFQELKKIIMKNILFSLIFVLLAGSLWAQQQTDVLQHKEHRMHNDPLMEQNANPDQDRMLTGKMDFLHLNMKNTKTTILVDSAFYSTPYLDYKQLCTYDGSGNVLTYYFQKWKNGAWENARLYTYTYDANGNLLTDLYQTAQTNGWRYVEFLTYTYDANGNILTYFRDKNGWRDQLHTYTYDANGSIMTDLYQEWITGAWINDRLNTYTNDANGNRLADLRQLWEDEEWMNDYLYTYTNDANGNKLTELRQSWEDSEWRNTRLNTYTYDSNGNELTELDQTWENNSWKKIYSYTYTYDSNGNRLSELQQHWENGVCVYKGLSTYKYDVNSQRIRYLYRQWENGGWENYQLVTYIYDDNGNRITYLLQYWGNDEWVNNKKMNWDFLEGQIKARVHVWDGSDWIKSPTSDNLSVIMGGEMVFSCSAINLELNYAGISGIENPQTNPNNSPIRCYPNPVTDQINLEIDPAWQAKNYQLELFSQTGQKVKSFKISSNIGSSIIPIKVDDVPAGLYLLRIEAGKQIFSQKIIISK